LDACGPPTRPLIAIHRLLCSSSARAPYHGDSRLPMVRPNRNRTQLTPEGAWRQHAHCLEPKSREETLGQVVTLVTRPAPSTGYRFWSPCSCPLTATWLQPPLTLVPEQFARQQVVARTRAPRLQQPGAARPAHTLVACWETRTHPFQLGRARGEILVRETRRDPRASRSPVTGADARSTLAANLDPDTYRKKQRSLLLLCPITRVPEAKPLAQLGTGSVDGSGPSLRFAIR
jgi:hypothetical protein